MKNSLLFDVSPAEDQKKRPAGKRRDAVEAMPPPTQAASYAMPAPRTVRAIGKLDHVHECAYQRCRGSAHDIVGEDGNQWLIQCCFCGTGQWVPVIKDHLPKRTADFVFRDGRFASQTIDEAAENPHGLEYITWAAASHKRDAVRSACRTWLDARRPTV